ncbi:MAG TPA: hypothetical protein VG844_12870 [Terracidiphilus sp.]|nr:hypothetical protein [Terracidiphilus sp.]
MGILLAFAPFIVFAIVDRIAGPTAGLAAGAAASAILLIRDLLAKNRSPKILEIGTFVLFCSLLIYGWMRHNQWSVIGVRLCVDVGLLLVVLVSMAVRRPFTMQYAREQVGQEFWNSPEFVRTNYIITGVWAMAFAAMVAAELALLYLPAMPRRLGIVVIVLALMGAVKFTGWYSNRVRSRPED